MMVSAELADSIGSSFPPETVHGSFSFLRYSTCDDFSIYFGIIRQSKHSMKVAEQYVKKSLVAWGSVTNDRNPRQLPCVRFRSIEDIVIW